MLQRSLLSKPVLGFIFPLWCLANTADSLRQLSTRGNDYIVGLLGSALIISRDGMFRHRAVWLQDGVRRNLPQLKALLADTTFLPRTILSDSPQLTVLGTVNTAHRSTELAVRRWNGTEWSLPEPLKELNSSAWDGHPALSPDGQWLAFASDRPGRGGLDLYISPRLPDGGWGTPQNLGAAVNTPADEAMPWFLPDGRLIFATRRYDHFPTRWKLAVARRNADGSWEWNAFVPPPLTSEDGNEISPVVWHDTLFFASDRRGGRGGYDLYAFPLCGPVTVVLHSNSPIPAARTTVTVSGSDGLERRWEAAPAELRFAARAFQHYTVRVHQPCRPPVEVQFQPPCDFSHSVVYHQTISLPKTFVAQTAVLPLPGNTAYRPLTTEHAWASVLRWSFQLRPTPLTPAQLPTWNIGAAQETELLLDSLVQLLYHLAGRPECLSSGSPLVEITGTAAPEDTLFYAGPPLSFGSLALAPGMVLSGQQLALVRAHALGVELQRRLPSPLSPLRWRFEAQLSSGNPVVICRVQLGAD